MAAAYYVWYAPPASRSRSANVLPLYATEPHAASKPRCLETPPLPEHQVLWLRHDGEAALVLLLSRGSAVLGERLATMPLAGGASQQERGCPAGDPIAVRATLQLASAQPPRTAADGTLGLQTCVPEHAGGAFSTSHSPPEPPWHGGGGGSGGDGPPPPPNASGWGGAFMKPHSSPPPQPYTPHPHAAAYYGR